MHDWLDSTTQVVTPAGAATRESKTVLFLIGVVVVEDTALLLLDVLFALVVVFFANHHWWSMVSDCDDCYASHSNTGWQRQQRGVAHLVVMINRSETRSETFLSFFAYLLLLHF